MVTTCCSLKVSEGISILCAGDLPEPRAAATAHSSLAGMAAGPSAGLPALLLLPPGKAPREGGFLLQLKNNSKNKIQQAGLTNTRPWDL